MISCCTYAVIGTAFALNMLFNIPVWIGVLLTGLSTLILLALQQYGVILCIPFCSAIILWFDIEKRILLSWTNLWLSLHVIFGTIYIKTIWAPFCVVIEQVRKLEFLIAFLVFTIAACFFAELGYAKPDAKEVLKGLFVPELKGSGSTGLAISLLGAMVMPWVPHVICSHLIFLSFSPVFSSFISLCICLRHNLFLHSALVLSRNIPRSVRGIKVNI